MVRRVWPQKRDQELFSREVVVGDGYKMIQGGQLIEIKKKRCIHIQDPHITSRNTQDNL